MVFGSVKAPAWIGPGEAPGSSQTSSRSIFQVKFHTHCFRDALIFEWLFRLLPYFQPFAFAPRAGTIRWSSWSIELPSPPPPLLPSLLCFHGIANSVRASQNAVMFCSNSPRVWSPCNTPKPLVFVKSQCSSDKSQCQEGGGRWLRLCRLN